MRWQLLSLVMNSYASLLGDFHDIRAKFGAI